MHRVALAFVLYALSGSAAELRADWFSHLTYVMRRDYKRNACWPFPFTQPARESTKQPFWTMIDNGWRRQNLLGDHYFDPDTQALSLAGALRVRWIMTQLPQARRVVFVQRSDNTDATLARMDAVRKAITTIVPEGVLPPIIETDLAPVGAPADYVERVGQQYVDTIPEPRLPEADRVDTSL